MARKVVNRKELRAEAEAAEALGKTDAEGKPVKVKKAPVKRKSRAKTAEPTRMKLFWGVYNQSMKRVALYDFTQRKQAEVKAQELSASGKSPHFVQKVKDPITE
jgi:hypothetical protein